MKKAKTDSNEQTSSLIGFAVLVVTLLVLAVSYVIFPATATLLDHAPWFSWQLDKDLMPQIARARIGWLMVAMVIFSLAITIATWELRAPSALWQQRILLLALASLSLPMAMHMVSAWVHAGTMGGEILGTYEPDSWTRLTLVRDWLSGGGWYDHLVHRNNAPFTPIANHWTRPLDVIIATVVKLQGATELNVALVRAAVILPWVWTTLLVLALIRLAGRFGHAVATPLIVVACIVSDQVFWGYFMIGNADHHALLGALFAWAMVLLTGTPSARDARVAGLLLALMLWISPEALVLIGGLYLYFGICWLRWPERPNPLVNVTTVTAMGVAAALLIERPPAEWFVPLYDSLSIAHVLPLLLCAGLAQFLATLDKPLRQRVVFTVIGGGVVVAIQYAIYPLFFAGPMAETDSIIKQYLLPLIFETQPLWLRPPVMILAVLWRPLLALAVGLWLWRRDRSIALLLYMALITQLLFMLQFRWCYYSYPLAVALLAAGIGRLLAGEKGMRESMAGMLAPLLLIMALEVPLVIFRGLPLFSPWSERTLVSTRQAHQWMYHDDLNHLEVDRSLIIAAPTALGSQLLFWTPYRIVASNYHREASGIPFVWNLNNVTSEDELRYYLRKRQVGALLLCFGTAPDGLLDKLRQGTLKPPAWLERVPLDTYLPAESAPAFFLVKQDTP